MNHEIRIPARALLFVLLTCKDERFYPYHPWDWDNYLHFHTIHHSLPLKAKSRQICHTWMVWVKKIPAETQISNIFAMEKSLIGGFLAKFEHGACSLAGVQSKFQGMSSKKYLLWSQVFVSRSSFASWNGFWWFRKSRTHTGSSSNFTSLKRRGPCHALMTWWLDWVKRWDRSHEQVVPMAKFTGGVRHPSIQFIEVG